MLGNIFISKLADGWSCRAGPEAEGQDRSQLLLLQEPASPLCCKQDEGKGLLAHSPSRDLGTHSAPQHCMSPASSAKPSELATGTFKVAVPDTANAAGVCWQSCGLSLPALAAVIRRLHGHRCVICSVFQGFQPEAFLSALQKCLNLMNPAFGAVRRNN